MTAAQQTATSQSSLQGLTLRQVTITKGNANDWVVLQHPGVLKATVTNLTGAPDTYLYGTATVATTMSATTTTTMSLTSATADRTIAGGVFVVRSTSGEMMLAITDSAPTSGTTTLTLIRGAYGTTASTTGLTGSSTVYLMNILVLQTGTGITDIEYLPMPNDPNAMKPNTTT